MTCGAPGTRGDPALHVKAPEGAGSVAETEGLDRKSQQGNGRMHSTAAPSKLNPSTEKPIGR